MHIGYDSVQVNIWDDLSTEFLLTFYFDNDSSWRYNYIRENYVNLPTPKNWVAG